MNLEIREATIDDIHELSLLRSKLGGGPEEHLKNYKKELNSVDFGHLNILFVAKAEHQLIGYGRVVYYDNDKNGKLYGSSLLPTGWYLRGLYVSDEWRGEGIASKISMKRLDWVFGKSNLVYCFINSNNISSIKHHINLGFKEINELPYGELGKERGKLFKFEKL